MKPFRAVIALGGNALLRRGESATAYAMDQNIRKACANIAKVMRDKEGCLVMDNNGKHAKRKLELIITHGNGPQVGLLAMQNAMSKNSHVPFDSLVSETEGVIGYALERHLMNQFPLDNRVNQFATIITQVEVSPDDIAFKNPTKFVGPMWTKDEAHKYMSEYGWQVRQDGNGWRRVVPSPHPTSILELGAIRVLVDSGYTVICAGGGGIPVSRRTRENADILEDWVGEEAVVDKDHSSALLAHHLDADALLLLTDVDFVYERFNQTYQKAIPFLKASETDVGTFPDGSMRPKVEAACNFVANGPLGTERCAMIGSLQQLPEILLRTKGTVVMD